MGVCFHAGQGCAIQTRMLLPRSRYEEGVEILRRPCCGAVPYGDPQRPDVHDGPGGLSAKQRERILGLHPEGRRRRGDPRSGWRPPATPDRGWFLEPTLFTDVDNSMSIAQEEIFGLCSW